MTESSQGKCPPSTYIPTFRGRYKFDVDIENLDQNILLPLLFLAHQAPPPPTEYGTQPQFHTQVLRTSSTEKILKSPPPTQLSIYSVE